MGNALFGGIEAGGTKFVCAVGDAAGQVVVESRIPTRDPVTTFREAFDFYDIDALNLDEDDPEYRAAMAISAGDGNTVRNVAFRNIRVDRIEEGKLINVRVI